MFTPPPPCSPRVSVDCSSTSTSPELPGDIHWPKPARPSLTRHLSPHRGSPCPYSADGQNILPPPSSSSYFSRVSKGRALAQACKAVFDTASLARGTMWGRVNVLVPELRPLTIQLARLFPDRAQRVQMEVSVGEVWVCEEVPEACICKCEESVEWGRAGGAWEERGKGERRGREEGQERERRGEEGRSAPPHGRCVECGVIRAVFSSTNQCESRRTGSHCYSHSSSLCPT